MGCCASQPGTAVTEINVSDEAVSQHEAQQEAVVEAPEAPPAEPEMAETTEVQQAKIVHENPLLTMSLSLGPLIFFIPSPDVANNCNDSHP
jgi:hypothetical protein